MTVHHLTVDMPAVEAAALDKRLETFPHAAITDTYDTPTVNGDARLRAAWRDRQQHDDKTPVTIWIHNISLRGSGDPASIAANLQYTFQAAIAKARKNLPPETRPLAVDDEWLDSNGNVRRAERLTGDMTLTSWQIDGAVDRDYWKYSTSEIVGHKRLDGSIIGPPQATPATEDSP